MFSPNTHILVSQHVGPHRVDLESPDIVHVHYMGDVELAHFQGFSEVMAFFPPKTPLYLLRNARNGGVVAPETRKHIATKVQDSRFVAIATYGASFQSKTVFSNMNRALKATRHTDTIPVEFFDTEQQARAWLEQQRADSNSP